MAYVVCFGFLNAEYRIAPVDFICSSRGRIRKLRLAYIVCLIFLNEEYLIALVDFIAPCGGTKGRRRRTLQSPSPPSSGLHLLTPGCPLRRGMIAAAGLCQYWIPVSGAVVTRQFRILYSYLCSGWYRSRFSRVAQLGSFVFHYWWGRSFVPAAT